MNKFRYIEVVFGGITPDETDMVIALLNDYGFDGFEEGEGQLKAYITESAFDATAFAELVQPYQLDFKIQTVEPQNWNTVWEEQFEPVVVNDFVGVRAHFHPTFAHKVQYEIVITPKMSFGTGHHATTWMMMEQMQHIGFKNKQVLDFGTGTGILAILSEKLGAAHVLAIDVDEWSIENAQENIERNDCCAINIQQADNISDNTKYNVILANINKNVIMNNFSKLNDALLDNGCLLISGLLVEDEPDILALADIMKLKHSNTIKKQQWISMLFTR